MKLLLISFSIALMTVACPPAKDDIDTTDNGNTRNNSPTPTYSPAPTSTYSPTPTYTTPTQTTMPGTEYPGTNTNGTNYVDYYPGGSRGGKSSGVARVLQGIIDIIFSNKDRHPKPYRTTRPKQNPTTTYPTRRPTATYPTRRPTATYPTRRPTATYPTRRPTYPSHRPTPRPSRYPIPQPSQYPTPTPTPFPTESSTPIVKQVGELFVISISNYHNYVSLRAEDKNGRNVYILSRVEGKLSHGDNDYSRRRVKRFDGLFFTDAMDEVYLVAQKHHDRVRALFNVVPSSLSWEVLHDDVSVTLEVEGITSKQQQEDIHVSLYLQTLYGRELELKDTRRTHRRMTVNNGSGIASFIIKDKLNFNQGCYRWLVASDTHAFFGERFGANCR